MYTDFLQYHVFRASVYAYTVQDHLADRIQLVDFTLLDVDFCFQRVQRLFQHLIFVVLLFLSSLQRAYFH